MINSTTSSLSYSSLEEFIAKLKEIFQKLMSDYIELDLKIADFKKSSDNFISSLENQKGFEEELYFYLNIKDMLYYLFDDVKLLIDHANFINSIFNRFFQLMSLKLDNNENYISYCSEFESFLIKQEKYFYSKIYEPSKFHNRDALNEITSLLMR